MVRGYDFLVHSVWPEVVCNIEAKTPSIFAPGNPDIFKHVSLILLEYNIKPDICVVSSQMVLLNSLIDCFSITFSMMDKFMNL